jgi:hypothetical protein
MFQNSQTHWSLPYLPYVNYERPDISCAGFTQLIRSYPKLHGFQRYILLEREMEFQHSQRLVYNSVLVLEVQILKFLIQVLNSWIHFEKLYRTLIFTCCGIIDEVKKLISELQFFQG